MINASSKEQFFDERLIELNEDLYSMDQLIHNSTLDHEQRKNIEWEMMYQDETERARTIEMLKQNQQQDTLKAVQRNARNQINNV